MVYLAKFSRRINYIFEALLAQQLNLGEQTRPGLVALIFLSLGLILAKATSKKTANPLWGLICFALILVMLSCFSFRRRRLVMFLAGLMPFIFLRSFILFEAYHRQEEVVIPEDGLTVDVSCDILRSLEHDIVKDKATYLVKIKVSETIPALRNTRMLVYGPSEIRYHSSFAGKLKIFKAMPALNPGGFSQEEYARGEGSCLMGQVANRYSLGPERLTAPVLRSIDGFGKDLIRDFQLRLGDGCAALLSALSLGKKSNLDWQVKESLLRSGLSHLASVSGYHLYFVLRPLSILTTRRNRLKLKNLLLSLLILLPWLILVGPRAGLIRAFILFIFSRIGLIVAARKDGLNSVAWISFIILAYEPFFLHKNAFILSMVATAAILVLAPKISAKIIALMPGLGKGVSELIGLSVALQIFMTLPQYLIFWHINPFSLALNILGASLVSLIFVSLLMYIPIFLLFRIRADLVLGLLAKVLSILISVFRELAEFGAKMPFQIMGYKRLPYLILFLFVLIFGYMFSRRVILLKARRRLFLTQIISLFLASFFLFSIYARLNEPEVEVRFLAVGQGNSIYISYGDKDILFDGGVPEQAIHSVLPFMRWRGIAKFDLAIISHGHNDHIGGILELSKFDLISEYAYPPSEIDEPNSAYNREFWRRFKQISGGIELQTGNSLYPGLLKHFRLNVLAPAANRKWLEDNKNDASIVLSLKNDKFELLLTADATAKVEKEMIEKSLITKKQNKIARILLLAHHGSETSSTEEFLSVFKPDLAIISVGKNNYGHPKPAVISRVEKTARILRTDKNGMISLFFTANDCQIETMLDSGRYKLCEIDRED